jgi:DNA polymerase alpha subunit B
LHLHLQVSNLCQLIFNFFDFFCSVDMEVVGAEAINPNQRISPYLSKVVNAPAQTAQPKTFTPQGPGKFKERCANGTVHSVLNEHIPAVSVADEGKAAAEIEILGDSIVVGSRFMVDRIADKAAYLDHRISTFEREIEAACGEGYPHAVGTASQNPTIFVGRICCDTEDGRLNPQSVVLEGSSGLSNGARVKIDLSGCKDYRLFPGQVACIKGTNPSGFCIVASEVLPGLPLRSAANAKEPAAAPAASSFSCMVAAGPYTTAEDLLYEPLAALLEYATLHKPDVLLLAGPFVDAEHAEIRSGLLEESFDQIYQSRIVAQLADFSSRVGGSTRILLLPSPKDVHHDPTFPQGPMTFDGIITAAAVTAEKELTNLPNPCTFKCNDVIMGCSSVDWLMSCTKEEISQASKPADRLPSMASHIINQRTYFPMFPPPAHIPMDTSRGYGLELPCTPNILVAPSDLAPFAKVVAISHPDALVAENNETPVQENGNADAAMTEAAAASSNVVCINPGRVTKGTTAGTFIHMWVAESGEGGVETRCRVEVKKL